MSIVDPRRRARVAVPYGDSPSQHLEMRFPRASAATSLLLVVHGGFWRARHDLRHLDGMCAALTRAGFITANVEYRRRPEPGSGWPGTFEDVEAALGLARRIAGERCARMESVLALGHSAGGHLALWLAGQQCGLDGVIALAPVACLAEAWRRRLGGDAVADLLAGTPGDLTDRYDSACPARRPAFAPRLLIHGSADGVVPPELSQRYLERRAADPVSVRLDILPGAGHFDLIDPTAPAWPSVVERIRSFVHQLVRPAGAAAVRH